MLTYGDARANDSSVAIRKGEMSCDTRLVRESDFETDDSNLPEAWVV